MGMGRFTNKLVCGDCIELLEGVEPFADLVFADPPFNIGYKYDKYKDKVKSEKYVAWSRDWMGACVGVLKPAGSFYIAIGDDYAAHIRVIGEELGLTLRNWIIWHYTFGQQTKQKFARAHTHIFYFIKDKDNYTFNDHAVRVPSDRQLTYNDKRANPAGKMPDDVWNEYSRVCGTFKERVAWHPCQMPETLLARIIAVSSNEGDLVFDPFNGSGTTAATAVQLGRDYAGIDVSEDYVENAKKRIAGLKRKAVVIKNIFGSLDSREMLELKRLYADIAIDAKEVTGSEKLLGIFTKQFGLRMNNGKEYDKELVAAGIMEFVY
ncbi:MAG TPA: site-specific DNA-methyltransferase [Phycisphaerales bacterium]|nr:site-specific DNA-methyltransferase [Phycisphaerales bacterium]